jgi:hypothetical protein
MTLTATPAMATTAAMVSTGRGAAGALRPQSAPLQPDGKVGAPSAERAVMPLAEWLPVSRALGMKAPSTVATSTTTRHQRNRNDMGPNLEDRPPDWSSRRVTETGPGPESRSDGSDAPYLRSLMV